MLIHYIKLAIRNFRSNKVIFVGSLATLCLGALCISLLFSYVYNELTMDDFHNNKKDIYMVTMKRSPKSEWSLPFKNNYDEYPEVKNSTSLINFEKDKIRLKYNNDIYTPTGVVVDSSFFKVFNFELTIGDKNTILNDYEAIILTEDFSEKLFGDVNPIGKEVDFESPIYQGHHIVKGIVKIPSNSSLKFDVLIPNAGVPYGSWVPFVRLKKGTHKSHFDEKIKKSNNNYPYAFPKLTESTTKTVKLKDLYFNNNFSRIKTSQIFSSGNRNNVDILIIFIFIILLVSIFNFSNLQIVNINSIIKNIVIFKINGALKKDIYYQNLVENIIIIGMSAIILTISYNLILPFFNGFMNVNLKPPFSKVLLINVSFLILITGVGLIYPIIKINHFSTVLNINKKQQLKGKQIIVVLQYALAVILLISSIIVSKQLQLMLSKDLGFNTNNIMRVKMYYPISQAPIIRIGSEEKRVTNKKGITNKKEIFDKPEYIKNQLASFSGIKTIGQGRSPLDIYQVEWKTMQETSGFESLNTLLFSTECQDIFGFELLEGRLFDNEMDHDQEHKILINEAAKKHLGIEDISMTTLENISWGKGFKIIGVVKDFNYEHLASKPKPLIIYRTRGSSNYFILFHNNQNQETITQIHELFNELNPNQAFNYTFLSDDIATLYKKEKRLSTIYMVFTIIALVISAIGLFTIALYDTQRRVKEVGVRKVNGATIHEIMFMLNKDFLKWVIIAFLIACPVAYYAMHKWLENFAYKTALSWWVFALAGVFTMVIALLTVSWQTYKAAAQNPVKSLRDE
ncbi:FtsX-like permease family protein [Aestuariibaculum sediminum]|uniref:ABC transporter permease n=1 Tax=Aestuariibaculum sediminum TaxID=2770637 RepID=A0A8J6U916_9FLAO|nr:ABC transporter permease [Aestuariibaculum sediminum]MBD0833773.1 ABC transporter permease [Aestuariibaculum sediminum]